MQKKIYIYSFYDYANQLHRVISWNLSEPNNLYMQEISMHISSPETVCQQRTQIWQRSFSSQMRKPELAHVRSEVIFIFFLIMLYMRPSERFRFVLRISQCLEMLFQCLEICLWTKWRHTETQNHRIVYIRKDL